MSRKNKRVCFTPDVNDDKPTNTTIFLKHGEDSAIGNRTRKNIIGTCSFKLSIDPSLSPVRFLARLGTKVASAVRDVSVKRRSSRKVSSSSLTSTLVRSCSLSDLTDPHRAETVQDCILFLHSSSSRERPS